MKYSCNGENRQNSNFFEVARADPKNHPQIGTLCFLSSPCIGLMIWGGRDIFFHFWSIMPGPYHYLDVFLQVRSNSQMYLPKFNIFGPMRLNLQINSNILRIREDKITKKAEHNQKERDSTVLLQMMPPPSHGGKWLFSSNRQKYKKYKKYKK